MITKVVLIKDAETRTCPFKDNLCCTISCMAWIQAKENDTDQERGMCMILSPLVEQIL